MIISFAMPLLFVRQSDFELSDQLMQLGGEARQLAALLFGVSLDLIDTELDTTAPDIWLDTRR